MIHQYSVNFFCCHERRLSIISTRNLDLTQGCSPLLRSSLRRSPLNTTVLVLDFNLLAQPSRSYASRCDPDSLPQTLTLTTRFCQLRVTFFWDWSQVIPFLYLMFCILHFIKKFPIVKKLIAPKVLRLDSKVIKWRSSIQVSLAFYLIKEIQKMEKLAL